MGASIRAFALPPVPPVLAIEAPAFIDMAEGVTTSFRITGQVQAGHPVLSFTNLPAWALFDPTTSTITATPPFGTGLDPSNPSGSSAAYVMTVSLSSDLDPTPHYETNIVILVHHMFSMDEQAAYGMAVHPQCTASSECSMGQKCVGNICQTSGLNNCSSDMDCPRGEHCAVGQCRFN